MRESATPATGRSSTKTLNNTTKMLVSVTKDSYEGWYSLGLVCQKLNRFDDAIEAYTQSLRLREDSAGRSP